MLFGQFRQGEASDPETYTASIAAVLSLYPEEVIRDATDPRTGLASRCKWLPHVQEVREMCDELIRPLQDAERRRRVAEETVRDRHIDRGGRPTMEELRAKHGPSWGIACVMHRAESFDA